MMQKLLICSSNKFHGNLLLKFTSYKKLLREGCKFLECLLPSLCKIAQIVNFSSVHAFHLSMNGTFVKTQMINACWLTNNSQLLSSI